MPKILIYTKSYCPYCDYAKDLLTNKNLSYTEVDVEHDEKELQTMLSKSNGLRTVPQIFINDKHIGGFDNLSALNKSGELDQLIK
jgi:glutaredoxin 3